MATIWRSSPLSNWQASAACFTPDATWESNWCTALRPPGRNPSGNMGKPKPGENGFDFQIFPSTNPVIIQWYNQPLDNIQWLSSDYPVIIILDLVIQHNCGRLVGPPKKNAPFSTVFLWPRLSQLASTAALQWPKPHVTEFLGSQALGVGKPGWLFNVATLWAPVISWFISPSNYSYKYHKP